jgi:membrane dipeptidase
MKESQGNWSRRKFIYGITGTGAVLMLNPRWSFAAAQGDPRVNAIVAKTIGTDTHNHIDVPIHAAELPGPTVDLSGEMKKSGLSVICMTFAVDYQPLQNPGDAYDRFINGLNAMDVILETNKMKRSLNLADIRSAHDQHQPTVVQSAEGGHFLEGKLDRLGIAYGRGLRQLGLLHDHDAAVPLGDVYTNPAQFGGLTKFGSEVIKECNRLGILIDLTHASNTTIDAALKVTTHPVIISHTGLDTQLGQNAQMANMMRPRLISKQQAKIVADSGGVIGVWTHLSDSPMEYAQNIRAMVDVVGINHVCIGTDTKMTPSYRSPDLSSSKPSSPAPPSVVNNPPRIGERTNEAWADQKAGFYYVVVDALLKTGFSEDDITRIGGANFCRIFDEATKGH